MSAVTIQELELETAELLPARETLVVGVDPRGPIRYPGPVYPDPRGPDHFYPPGPVPAWGE
jgi:hypothetical protein